MPRTPKAKAVGEHADPGAVCARRQAVVVDDLVGAAVVAVAPGCGDEQRRDGQSLPRRERRRRLGCGWRNRLTGMVSGWADCEVMVMPFTLGTPTVPADRGQRPDRTPCLVRSRAGSRRPYSASMPWARRTTVGSRAAGRPAPGRGCASSSRWHRPRRRGSPWCSPSSWCRCRAACPSSSPDDPTAQPSACCWGCCRWRSHTWPPRRSGSSGWRRTVGPRTGPGSSRPRPRTPGGCSPPSACCSSTSRTVACRRARWRWVPPTLVVSAALVQAYGAFEDDAVPPAAGGARPPVRSAACLAGDRRPRVLPHARAVRGLHGLARAPLPALRRDRTSADQVAGAGRHRDAALPASCACSRS